MSDYGNIMQHAGRRKLWPACYLLLEPCFVEVLTAVAEVADGSVSMEFRELIEVDIGNENHLSVRCCLCAPSVIRELEVTRGEHSRLRILDVHILNARQIAYTAGNSHVALILDGPGLRTDTHPVVGILRVGHEAERKESACHRRPRVATIRGIRHHSI